jgi:flavin reductase (DIM6/NTAB) family NADH-FMN oxidoreductase RutF
MIREFPISMECQVIHAVELAAHDGVIGQIIETYCDEECLTDGAIDYAKVNPILLVPTSRAYCQLGPAFATAWEAGKELQNRSQ